MMVRPICITCLRTLALLRLLLPADTHPDAYCPHQAVILPPPRPRTVRLRTRAEPRGLETLVAIQDTFINEDKDTENKGDDNDLKLKPDSKKVIRPLIKFDLSSILAGATVNAATLRLYVTRDKDGQTVNIHRVTHNWVEGTGNNGSGADWNTYDGSNGWASGGGDFDATIEGSFNPDTKNVYKEINLTDLVQAWVDGTYANEGLLLNPTGPNGETKIGSRENSGKEPQLVVDWTLPRRVQPA